MKRIDHTIWILGICLIFIIFYFVTQPTATYKNGIFLDAKQYFDMAKRSGSEWPMWGIKPFVYRIGLPWLVGQLADESIFMGFKCANVTFGILTLVVFILFLKELFAQWWVVALLSLLFTVNIHSPFRFNLFYPMMTDAPMLFFSACIMYLSIRQDPYSWHVTTLMTVLSFLGTLFRETVLLAPITVCLADMIRNTGLRLRPLQILYRSLPVLAGMTSILITHKIVIAEGAYTFSNQAMRMLHFHFEHPLIYLLTPWATYGVVFFLPIIFFHTHIWHFCKKYPILPIYAIGCFLLTLIGGYHGVRFMFWGYISILPLIGVTLENLISRYSRGITISLLLFMTVAQVLSMNPFGMIPDIPRLKAPDVPAFYVLFPYGEHAHYNHLAPHTMSHILRHRMLYQYLLIGVCLFLARIAMRRQ